MNFAATGADTTVGLRGGAVGFAPSDSGFTLTLDAVRFTRSCSVSGVVDWSSNEDHPDYLMVICDAACTGEPDTAISIEGPFADSTAT